MKRCPFCAAAQSIKTLGAHRCFTCGRFFYVFRDGDELVASVVDHPISPMWRTLLFFFSFVLTALACASWPAQGGAVRRVIGVAGLAGTAAFFMLESRSVLRRGYRALAAVCLRAVLLICIAFLGFLALRGVLS
ncbi:MAG: hypothetical protein JXR37_16245 [Kiritimatiellae bacterium]|nr:hypothetical protein [Kiritimatiellia bacterium]